MSWVTTKLLGLENLLVTTKLLKDCHQMGYFLKNKTICSPPQSHLLLATGNNEHFKQSHNIIAWGGWGMKSFTLPFNVDSVGLSQLL